MIFQDILKSHPTLFFSIVISLVTMSIIMSITIIILKFKNEEKIIKNAIELKTIIDNVTVGIVRLSLENGYEINYANKTFYSMLGYTYQEAMELDKTSIMDFVPDNVKEVLIREMSNTKRHGINNQVRIDTKMIGKENKIIDVFLSGNIDPLQEKEKMFFATILDLTKQKKLESDIDLERERHMATAELSDYILFEYELEKDEMFFTGKFQELFGKASNIKNFSKHLVNDNSFIYHDDWGVFVDFYKSFKESDGIIVREFRIKNAIGDYTWCQIKGKVIRRENKPVKLLGRIVNVDMYKREISELEYKATRDPLTGLYNRDTIKKKIDAYMASSKDKIHGFLFLDFDDFKRVNDNYGHLKGDKVLKHVTKLVQEVFGTKAVVGRIGGDEFLVFLGNLSDKDELLEKAEMLKTITNTVYKDDDSEVIISVSIGISMYPKDGLKYEKLIARADKALYQAKEEGKNKFVLFDTIK